MPEGHRHLTRDERCQIGALKESGLSDGTTAVPGPDPRCPGAADHAFRPFPQLGLRPRRGNGRCCTSEWKWGGGISRRLRAQVLERNGYTCQMCGAGVGDTMADGRRVRLHIGHITDKSHGGSDTLGNLRVPCGECNQGAKNPVQEPPSCVWLMSQVRRAREDDQRAVLDWLARRFGSI